MSQTPFSWNIANVLSAQQFMGGAGGGGGAPGAGAGRGAGQ